MKNPGEPHQLSRDIIKARLEQRSFTVQIGKRIPHPPIEMYQKLGRYLVDNFIPDIYAERGDEILMYEIGSCDQEKLDWLREHIGKTIHMPFIHTQLISPEIRNQIRERAMKRSRVK